MIPQTIHYCWFGSKEIPEKERRCIESWKVFLPHHSLQLWNEENIESLHLPLYAKQSYEARNYAFLSDCVRTKVLYEYGGIYFDTDFELIKPIDEVLKTDKNILGFETKSHIGTAIMAFSPKNEVMRQFLEYYETHLFISKGRKDIIANVSILTDILKEQGLICNRMMQTIGDILVYPRDYFFPKRLEENKFLITENTLGIHRCSNSWMSVSQIARGNSFLWRKIVRPSLNAIRSVGQRILGKERIRTIEIYIRYSLK